MRRSQGGVGADGSFAVPSTVKVPRTSSNLLKKSARRLLSVRNPGEAFGEVAGELELKFTPKLLDGVVVLRLAMLTKGPELQTDVPAPRNPEKHPRGERVAMTADAAL